ncbi:uncharacterized protein LY89DRAFT_287906 [Mollisia scopiformis]|uniref:Uncharacterized protein n=1 Tax=Mollisia scopiformis TaxID=149040 RepID=A0A132BAJ1_MOLSC|nr:uncharacterized protein LY89DRAFT_287906 [Mollisia scopiformis]KUJ09435.1 hypothetical protein LY89DRAFT_287906 [Mollisia scopiformis]
MKLSPHQEYEKVATNDSEESLAESPKSTRGRSFLVSPRKKIISLIITFTLLILVVLVFTTQINRALSAPSSRHCGRSREEAISLGCSFDQLTATWLPASCSRKWEDEFLNTSGMGYYTETHATEPVDFSKLEFNTTYHSNRVHHVAHCLYMFLRLGDKDSPLDGMTLDPHHQKHCVSLILREMEYSPRANIVKDPGHIKPGTC